MLTTGSLDTFTSSNTNPQCNPNIMSTPKKALIVGLSGCSSSGKTTIARLLRDMFPHTFIMHEDDFYRPDNE